MGLFYASVATLSYFILILLAYFYMVFKSRFWVKNNAHIILKKNEKPEKYNGFRDFLGDGNVPEYIKNLGLMYVYKYRFEGKNYESKNIFLGDFFMYSAKTTLQPYSKLDLRVGDQINMFLDPKYPENAVMYKMIPKKLYLFFFFLVGFSIFCIFLTFKFDSNIAFLGGDISRWIVGFLLGFFMWFFDFLRASHWFTVKK